MPRKLTTEEFVSKAERLHTKYTYEKTIYINSHTKVIITCPIHGDFRMKPNNHLSGHQGCPTCKNENANKEKLKSQETFINEMFSIHKDVYDLSKAVYTGAHNPITVTHNTCNSTFTTTPTSLKNMKSCPVCSINKLKQSTEHIKEKAKHRFLSFIEHSEFTLVDKYQAAKVPIVVQHTCGYTFSATPDNLLRKSGCPNCAKYGFDPAQPAVLYYLSIDNGKFFKIGITNRSVEERFTTNDLTKVEVLHQVTYTNGSDAYAAEQRYLKRYKQYRYNGPDILSSGNTELFTTNILNLKEHNA